MAVAILNAEPVGYSAEARALLKGAADLREEECDRNRLLELLPDFDVLIVRLGHRIDGKMIASGRKLKAIVTPTTGLNHIDLHAARARGIQVLSLKGERDFLDTVTATAELTWGLILTLIRNIPAAYACSLNGEWDRNRFIGRELSGKTLGIVGYGRLGAIVAGYGTSFRMRVLVCDRDKKDRLPAGAMQVSLEELLDRSDVISLHANLDEESMGFFGQPHFAKMKRGSFFVNTARGELIDEAALLEALENGWIAGAALDVLTGETQKGEGWLKDHPLWNRAREHGDVILTPHIGGATRESMEKTEVFMAKKLISFLSSVSAC